MTMFSLLLIVGLALGEWLHRTVMWPKVIGYVLAGSFFGPLGLEWIDIKAVSQARPLADVAMGFLLLEVGRRIDLNWLKNNPALIKTAGLDMCLSFPLIFLFSLTIGGLSPAWSAATAAITMGSAPAIVLLTIDETKAQGPTTERILLHTSLISAASFLSFSFVLGAIHAEESGDLLTSIGHPIWVAISSVVIAWICSAIALTISTRLPKQSLAQVFILIAATMLAVGLARTLLVPVFLPLFLTGVLVATRDRANILKYTALPETHWLLSIVLFVIVGASLPWHLISLKLFFSAVLLLLVRLGAKALAFQLQSNDQTKKPALWVTLGIQPLSATAVVMSYELANLYPETGMLALTLPLFAAAIMELVGPVVCRYALTRAGEIDSPGTRKEGKA